MIATRLALRNYGGVEFSDVKLPAEGVIFTGRNESGKSTHLDAFRALLERRGIAPEAIRNGAEEAEIRIDFEHASVRALLRRNGESELQVIENGIEVETPPKWLKELIRAPLDPLDFFLQRPSESAPAARRRRRDAVVRAIPVKVTARQLRKYVPRLPDDYNISGHGLDVVERLYSEIFALRTTTNAERDATRAEKDRADRELESALASVPPGAVPSAQVLPERDRTRMAVLRIEAQTEAARTHAARQAASRKRAADERAAADSLDAHERSIRPGPNQNAEAQRLYELAQTEDRAQEEVVADLARRLEDARRALEEKRARTRAAGPALDRLADLERQADALKARAEAARNAAASIEAGLAESAGAPDAGALDRARAGLALLEAAVQAGLAFDRAAQLKMTAEILAKQLAAKERRCAEMDRAVVALREEAPADILPPDAIAGLSLRGDDIFVNGVPLERLSGSQQLKFAVRLAKLAARQNSRGAEILLADDLERLDPDQYAAFLAMATEDGWQLIATRVQAGKLTCEWIRPSA